MNKEVKKAELQALITETGIALIKSEGFENVTMEEIARQSFITKRTLYKYFPVKEAIVEEYIRISLFSRQANLIIQINKIDSFDEQVVFYLEELMSGVIRESRLFEIYIIYIMKKMVSFRNKDNQKQSGVTDPLKIIIASGMKQKKISQKIPEFMILDLFLFSFVEMTKVYYSNPDSFNLHKTIDVCSDIFLKSVNI